MKNTEAENPNLESGRYLLFLDILGFSDRVEKHGVAHVYATIDNAVQCFERWQGLNGDFRTIYFSDTFLFYQEPKGYGDWAFLDMYAIGGMILSALLAQGIPARGAISFGEFEVHRDRSDKHQLYFGKALLEAYRAEQRENWIGITILPSAWQPWNTRSGSLQAFESEGVWRLRSDDILMLMPFIKLRSWYVQALTGELQKPYLKWDQPDFPNELKAFDFLRKTSRHFIANGDFSGKVATKYHSTLAFLEDIMGREFFAWVQGVCDDELPNDNS